MKKWKQLPVAAALAVLLTGLGASGASAQPDLIVTGFTAPAEMTLGEPYQGSVTMFNQGTSDVTSEYSVFFSIFLSADGVLDASDVCAGYGSMVNIFLTAGSGGTEQLNLQVNAASLAAGEYYLIASADSLCGTGRIAESDETNNELLGSTVTVLAQTDPADLTLTDLIGPTTAKRGEYLRLDTYLLNQGTGPAPGLAPEACGYYVSYYLSTDTTITSGDIPIGTTCGARLEGGELRRYYMDVLVPAGIARGFYYWGAIADSTDLVVETDEGNNAFASPDRVHIH